ncbi:septum site-determining protein MinC [Vampirovibrio sp.]|uniref:septum site-determining protein MinC n=1 Tax=Vampirovibrio sp. TaxID=2717857 RepID=UPI0035935040
MVEIQDSNHSNEVALLLDLSKAGNSAQACQFADDFVARINEGPVGAIVDINAGDLLLTRGVLTKIKQQIHRASAAIGIVYATVPQTQQAALDEGLFVKEKFTTGWTPIRQSLPLKKAPGATRPDIPSVQSTVPQSAIQSSGAVLPDFSSPTKAGSSTFDFEAVAPQSLDMPELAESQLEERLDLVLETEQVALAEGIFEVSETLISQEILYSDTALNTLYLHQTLRSGKTVRFNGNIVIIGDVHAGSEITAGGDIVVWGELRGIAHAGAQGNYKSEIRAMKIEALQLRIADYIARRPDRIYYHKDGVESHDLSPEVARVADAEIKIFKTMLPKG